ncbi:MAG TPA: ABC transporter permease [Puia sp.]|jgi:putative ABC transport system permease protein|nr:ABC transporter permease [Puia sp.]
MGIKVLLRIAFRQSGKGRRYTFLNIAGLAGGIACCLLIFEYVAFERSYDRFNPMSDRIVRIQDEEYQNGKLIIPCASAMPNLAPLMIKEFPEVETACRLYKSSFLLSNDARDLRFSESNIYYADSSVLNVFNLQLTEGDRRTALSGADKILLSATQAKKYFGNEDPLGKVLTIRSEGKKLPLEVTGVFPDLPANSHLRFDLLVAYKTFGRIIRTYGNPIDPMETRWRWTDFYTYVLLKDKKNEAGFANKLPAFIDRHYNDQPENLANRDRFRLVMMPMPDIHLYSHFIQEAEPNGDSKSVSFLFLIALFIVGIAWVNYTNLATARSLERAREVGVRKVLGAQRLELIRQFMMESLALNGLALFVALIGAFSLNRPFGLLAGRPLGTAFTLPLPYWALFTVVFLTGTFLSGLYPALILSGYQPMKVLKGAFKNSTRGQWVRKGLIVGQFAISIILIASTIIVYKQVSFMRSQRLGADIDQTLVLKGPTGGAPNGPINAAFREEILGIIGVKSFTASSLVMGEENLFSTDWEWIGNPHGRHIVETRILGIDEDFIPAYRIRMIAGRNITRSIPSDRRSVLLNESAVKSLDFPSPEAAIGQLVSTGKEFGLDSLKVLGVVADYHYEGLQKVIEPLVFVPHAGGGGGDRYSIKIEAADIAALIPKIKTVWDRNFPDDLFSYFFLDDFFGRQYVADQRFGTVFGLFALFAVAIACFGLLGLSAYNVLQRSKEISIRKILGANEISLLYLLSVDFLLLVVAGLVIAVPVAWIVMGKWLQSFAYRIEIRWWIFGLAGALALMVAFFTVGRQAWKAAMTSPIKNLKSE